MTEISIDVPGGYRLTSLRTSDAEDLVRCLGDGEIASVIPVIPQPYDRAQAVAWIEHRSRFLAKWGREISFAIRREDGTLIGSVAVDDYPVGRSHNGELGYWVARDARRRGVARVAVRSFLEYAFQALNLERVTARTLVKNDASASLLRVLGFEREGLLRRFTRIGDTFHDTVVFGLLKEEFRRGGA